MENADIERIFSAAICIAHARYGMNPQKMAFAFTYKGSIVAIKFPGGFNPKVFRDLERSAKNQGTGLMVTADHGLENIIAIVESTVSWACKNEVLGGNHGII